MYGVVTCPNCHETFETAINEPDNLVFCFHCRESFQVGHEELVNMDEGEYAAACMTDFLKDPKLDSSFWLG